MSAQNTTQIALLDGAPNFIGEGAKLLEELASIRREIHKNPEIGLDLPITQSVVLKSIEGLGLEITTGTSLSSVTAVLRGAKPGPTVLLRGDMDALPLVEENELDYRSTNENMHACGHDLHTAGLIGAVKLLAAQRESIAGNVVFMFQPGEEGYNGASHMIREGILDASGDKPIAAYAAHVGTGDLGVFRTRSGPMLASSSSISAEFIGLGGHGSNPSAAKDPMPALAETILAAQNVVTRNVNVHDPAVLSVTRLVGGEANNVIPDRVAFSGTLRTYSTPTLDRLEGALTNLVSGVAAAHGIKGNLTVDRDYPVTVNDAQAADLAERTILAMFGEDRYVQLAEPFMGSEDFSFVLEEVPGCYIVLGARPEQYDAGAFYAHSAKVQFDDSILGDQAALLAMLAWNHVGAA